MRIRVFSLLPALFICLIAGKISAQSCINTGINDTTINMLCNQACTTFTFQVPHVKSTDDYLVSTIPYNPYPYTTPGGGYSAPCASQDDRYYDTTNLPFTFCFYGATYSRAIISSNGLITFDLSNAIRASHYALLGNPIPFTGSASPTNFGCPPPPGNTEVLYPRASIMGVYHDLHMDWPSPNKKIEAYVTGTAPCRKYVVSYNEIPLFNCPSFLGTHQIVMHESTGIIEVFIRDKPMCTNWNGGRAILGIQDWTRTKAVAAPGKNCTAWSEQGTAYRFLPSGTQSRYVSSQMFTIGGVFVANADTLTTTAGLLDIRFPNFCPPVAGNSQFVIRTTWADCINPSNQMTSFDTINVVRTNTLGLFTSTTNTLCGPPNGTITVNVTGGSSPYTYILDGGAPVTGPSPRTFTNLAQGGHTIQVMDNSGNCTGTVNATVDLTNNLTATTSSTPATCATVNDGTITVTSSNGIGPFTFSLNGGPAVPGSIPFTFTNVPPASHAIFVNDIGGGCTVGPIVVDVGTGPGIIAFGSSTATTCPTINNGSITIAIISGNSPFSYQLDGGPAQPGGTPFTFTNVSPGPHTVLITDNLGCTRTMNVNVASGPALAANTSSNPTSCNGASNGSITITPTNGVGPYNFSLNAGPFIPGASPYTFNNLQAGNHIVAIRDAVGCISSPMAVTVNAGPALTTTATATDVRCNGGSTGSITVAIPTIGNPPYEYSLDNTNWQSSNVFNGLTAGTYTVYFREVNGCRGSLSLTVDQPPVISVNSSTTPVVCNGQSNGIINVAASGGVPPYQYSINGGANWQSSGTFNVPAGIHTITIRDANGCITTRPVTVTEPAALTASSITTNATCDGGNNGTITVNANGGNSNYIYSIDGLNFQASNLFNVGPGTFSITVRDNLGCQFSFPTTVDLTNNLTLTPSPDPILCEGSTVQLNVNSNATVYSWSPTNNLSNPNIRNPIADPPVNTQYIVTAVLGRCTTYDTVMVNIYPAPTPDAGLSTEICFGRSHQLQGSGGTIFQWSPSTYLNSTIISNPVVSSPMKSITYTLSVVDVLGCSSLVSDTVTVKVTPAYRVLTFPFDTIAYEGDRFQLTAFGPDSTISYNYNWSPTIGLNDPTINNPSITIGPIGSDLTYQVRLQTPDGCIGNGYVTVKVYKGPDIYVPTGFTPNGDGKNDRLTPFPVGIKQLKYFSVYNRWGQLLFKTTSLHQGWDGRFGGKEQATGVFAWIAEAITNQGKTIIKKGTVTLIR